jgi:hypothetical protein
VGPCRASEATRSEILDLDLHPERVLAEPTQVQDQAASPAMRRSPQGETVPSSITRRARHTRACR